MWTTAAVAATAVVVHLLAQAGALFWRSDWSLSAFRQYFSFDQLAYLSIVADVAKGQLAPVEPFTETGSSFYPRMYYVVVGLIAGATGMTPSTAWQVVGLSVQAILVITLAVVLIRLGRHPLVGLLAPLPFLLGTFSSLTDGGWFTAQKSHAVLWGPFAVLFTLNGESVALSLAAIALLLLVLAWLEMPAGRSRVALTLVAAAILGSLAAVQTYSFVAGVYIAAYAAAAWILAANRTRWALIATGVALVLLVVAGSTVTAIAGQLPALVFGLLPALPGLVVGILRTRGFAAIYLGAAVLAAAPQIVFTAAGIIGRDPFLVYRVASNVDLGVGVLSGTLSAIPVLLPLVLIAAAGLLQKRSAWVGLPLGGCVAWVVLATNNRWGPNAEPYRLWIDGFFLLAVAGLAVGVSVVRQLLVVRADAHLAADADAARPGPGRGRISRPVVLAAVGVVVLVGGVSALDWVRFTRDDAAHAMLPFDGARLTAQAELARSVDDADGLIATGPCIDPVMLKDVSGARLAHYHLGMAWPADRDILQEFMTARDSGEFDADAARAAGVAWVLTDSACEIDWVGEYGDELQETDTADYTEGSERGTITLSRFVGADAS